MPQSLAQLYVHIVFSTKYRQSLIAAEIELLLHSYISGILRSLESPVLRIGGMPDHLHILCQLSKKMPLCKSVGRIKSRSSHWIKTQGEQFRDFHWQNGYGAFSVCRSHIDRVGKYIARQKQHHAHYDFKTEFRAHLIKHEIDFDERYVWD